MGATSRQTIVFIPGLLCRADVFTPQIESLGSFADIIVADQSSHASMVDIAQAILADAPHHFSIVALSMGGYIAFEILRQAPERVERLVLIGANARADRGPQIKERHVVMGCGRVMGLRAVQGLFLPYLVHPARLADRALVDHVVAMADSHSFASHERQQQALIGRPDNRVFLAEIKVPTLIVAGRQDRLTPPKVADELVTGIAGSRLEVIEDCGHLATLERPNQLNEILARFLKTG